MKAAIVLIVLYVGIIIACVYGWINNILILLDHVGPLAEYTIVEIVRVIGIFIVPLGVLMGYF